MNNVLMDEGSGGDSHIRLANVTDALSLSEVRFKIDGETEFLDRVQGEDHLGEKDFKHLIQSDKLNPVNLFLVAELEEEIVGFSRCEGHSLLRKKHQVEFGVAVLKRHWGCGIGKALLKESVRWADHNGILKMTLQVVASTEKAIHLYKQQGFEIEGVLKKDKYLSDGLFYDTVLMGRLKKDECEI
ncbi:GNAT family N-acetyltransferase [Pontibacillus sp. HN14]